MCATCGSIGKYGQQQPEAIKADRLRLAKVTDKLKKNRKTTSSKDA